MIGTFSEKQVRTALRRTRSWFKRNPAKWAQGTYNNGHGCFCLVGRFHKELCNTKAIDATTGRLAPVYDPAHQVLVVLTKRLGDAGFYVDGDQSWGNDIRFGRVATINDLLLHETTELNAFIGRLEQMCDA